MRILLFFLLFTSLFAEPAMLLPPALQKGDLIALVFPASFLDMTQEEANTVLDSKAAWLQEQGYRTVFYPTQCNIYGYLSGSDEERAAALMEAWHDPEVKAIWCFRGGYGTPRILDLIDYDWIKDHPKILIGMSDTALHQAIQIKTGLVTFLAPVFNFFCEKNGTFDDQYAFSELEEALVHGRIGPVRWPKLEEYSVLRAGKARGKLVGGNLCLMASLCGTKWQADTEGKILILEDVHSEIFRIDRALWQLKEAGLLKKPAAVILGSWKNCRSELKNSLTLDQMFADYFKDADYPVIFGFPSGHDRYQTTVPLNVHAQIDTARKTVEILEPGVVESSAMPAAQK